MKKIFWALVWSVAGSCWMMPAAWSCQPGNDFVPQTALENVYCQLQHKGADLPSVRDFRRNSAAVQRLLLSRPAARAGIALPAVHNRKPAVTAEVKAVTPSAQKHPSPEPRLKPESLRNSSATTGVAAAAVSEDADSCRLFAEVIRCAHGDYRLVLNQPNQRLHKDSLSDSNRLQLSAIASGTSAQQPDLYGSYRHYIEKMLSIGLGGATMSYSKFYYTWEASQAQRQNFADRLATMFEYLKRDKKTLAVKPRYDHALPAAIAWCQPLSDALWTCDNKHRNWVYQR